MRIAVEFPRCIPRLNAHIRKPDHLLIMKSKSYRLSLIALTGFALQGCVAFPPLIQVEHKDAPANQEEVIKRLDAIDHRLDALEHQGGK
jgi:hypothetical protein